MVILAVLQRDAEACQEIEQLKERVQQLEWELSQAQSTSQPPSGELSAHDPEDEPKRSWVRMKMKAAEGNESLYMHIISSTCDGSVFEAFVEQIYNMLFGFGRCAKACGKPISVFPYCAV